MADVENVIIIGSGPAGYTAALYTARANLNPLVIEGFLWGGLLQQTTDVENYPGYPQGVMGPEMMQELRDQAERFGTRFITDNATKLEPGADGEPHTVWVDDEAYKARAVDPRHGRRAQEARRARRGGARRPRRVLLRDLRRRVLQGPRDDHRRRRRLGDGGGDLPREVLLQGHDRHRRDEFRASKIMLERARATENIEFLTPYVVEEFLAGENGALGPRAAAQRRDRRDARAADGRRVHRDRPRAAVGDRRRASSTPTRRLRRRPRASRRAPTCPGVFAAGDLVDHTYRQAVTAAGSGCQAALDAEWYLRDNPPCRRRAALEGTGDLAEQQWAPGDALSRSRSA